MKKRVEKPIGMKRWMLVFTCILCVIGFLGNAYYSKAAAENSKAEESQFDIKATFGFDNVARVRKSMIANISVANHGEDFSGLLQILVPVTEGNNVMYESEISIAAGETKNVSMPVYVNNYTRKLVVNLTDEKEKVIAEKRVKVNLLTSEDSTKMFAILTDNKDVLGYWEEEETKVFYLSEKDMPEQTEGLEALDALIINNFDTQNLNKKQYEALKDWVDKGGNLIIGTGVNVNRTLGVFEDDFLTGSFEAADKDGKVDINVEDASVFQDRKNDISMQQLKKDMGSVLLFSSDLGVDYADWKKKGAAIKNMAYEHMSNIYVSEEESFFGDSYGLDLTDKGKLPSMKKFAIVLFIYVVVVSWILYFVLRKKDKLEWTWGFVPATAFLFAIVVYCMGSATRITAPFLTYARVIEWSGEGELTGKGTSRIAITSPYNEKYSVAVPKGVTAYAGGNNSDYYVEEETNLEEYKMGFRQSGDQQIITLNNFGAFETAAVRTNDVVSMEGSYEADITCNQYDFNGTFTNKAGREIRNAVFTSDGRVYQLGTIKDGETVKISDKCKNVVSLGREEYFFMDGDSWLGQLFGLPDSGYYGTGGTLEEKRFERAVRYCICQNGMEFFMQGKVIGILDSDGTDEEMTQNWGIDSSGITLGVFPIDVNYANKDGQTFVSDLYSYSTVESGDLNASHYMYGDGGELRMEYSLKKNETLTALYYLASVNQSIEGNGKKGKAVYTNVNEFEGEILAYNYAKKEYEKIFDGGKEGKITDVKRFVSEENKVLLKMIPKDDSEYAIPVISATKEVK